MRFLFIFSRIYRFIMKYEIIKDNIVSIKEPVEAIINSANRFMSMGGGVCGAIHKAAGI